MSKEIGTSISARAGEGGEGEGEGEGEAGRVWRPGQLGVNLEELEGAASVGMRGVGLIKGVVAGGSGELGVGGEAWSCADIEEKDKGDGCRGMGRSGGELASVELTMAKDLLRAEVLESWLLHR